MNLNKYLIFNKIFKMSSAYEVKIMNMDDKISKMEFINKGSHVVLQYLKKLGICDIPGINAEEKLNEVNKAIESASSPDEQILVSKGMPLIFDKEKKRYYLSSNALNCMIIYMEILNKPLEHLKLLPENELKKRLINRVRIYDI